MTSPTTQIKGELAVHELKKGGVWGPKSVNDGKIGGTDGGSM
jgi:hypothetical protein